MNWAEPAKEEEPENWMGLVEEGELEDWMQPAEDDGNWLKPESQQARWDQWRRRDLRGGGMGGNPHRVFITVNKCQLRDRQYGRCLLCIRGGLVRRQLCYLMI